MYPTVQIKNNFKISPNISRQSKIHVRMELDFIINWIIITVFKSWKQNIKQTEVFLTIKNQHLRNTEIKGAILIIIF